MTATQKTSHWPGERDPSYRDVASASERPDPALLSNFKRVLMASDDAIGVEALVHIHLKERQPRWSGKYTYPLALLSSFPKLPEPDRIADLCRLFPKACLQHVFFEHFPSSALSHDSIAPLRFGIAALASVSCGGGINEVETLYRAGASLWPTMVEVDNSLARSIEMLLAAVLLIPCGVLAATESLRTRASLLLPSSITIARRMQLHNPGQLGPGLRQRLASYSPLLWSLWLWDMLHALHSDHTLNVSSTEVQGDLPSTTTPFHHVYRDLLQDHVNGRQPLLFTLDGESSRDQALLLLLAILTDSITARRSLDSPSNAVNPAHPVAYKLNPFILYSDQAELARIQAQLSLALDRWDVKFGALVSPDIKALALYCRLYLSCPVLSTLHRAVLDNHAISPNLSGPSFNISVSDESVNYAWAILDTAAGGLPQSSLCPAWMPICVFHAALVVWANIRSDKGGGAGARHGSIRALLAFKVELEGMQWPCCGNMAAALQDLMSA
ncbi:hypothetical protein GE09DRAFT_1185078 [Coniochaeta sp. 2T2.1]|nr:hypothetical protein GE09DRAFT_1185078 [Coniochaeta sp. 2T2.1]